MASLGKFLSGFGPGCFQRRRGGAQMRELVADIVQVARDYRVLREGADCT